MVPVRTGSTPKRFHQHVDLQQCNYVTYISTHAIHYVTTTSSLQAYRHVHSNDDEGGDDELCHHRHIMTNNYELKPALHVPYTSI